ncbi:MAG: hypothetical protein AAGA55_06970 [Planctomycetota bacterium]
MLTKTSVLLTALFAAPVVAMTACSGYQPPKFEAVGVREIERTEERAVLAFSVEATNPNREPMELGPATYTVWLDGREVFTGVRSPQSTLHTYSSHVFELPAVIPANISNAGGEIDYQLRGIVVYKNPGALSDVLFDADFVVPEAALDLAGTIDRGG